MKESEYKSKVVEVFRKVFPEAENKSALKESWIEFAHNGERYGIRFKDAHLWQSIKLNIKVEIMAAEMLREAVTFIAEEGLK